jgi:CubicO group peptidase (beta-lactamase class C family)
MPAFVILIPLLALSMLSGCASPETASPDTTSRIDALFADYDRPDAPGASVLVLKDGDEVYKKAFGIADLEAGAPATPATNYRLASVTKQFTAMAVLVLVDDGRLALDARLTDLYPDFPAYGQAITVRHLLTHTSGLIDYEDLIPDTTIIPLKDRDVLASMMGQDSTYFQPGSQFRYSNSAYAVLAMLVEQVSGQSFAAFLADRLFEPLGMAGTVAFEEGISTVPNRAFGYAGDEGRFARNDQSLTSAVLGDGGVYSSVDDLRLWYRAIDEGRLLSAPLMAEVFTPAENTLHDGAGYGYGWFVGEYAGRPSVWHTGSTVGFRNAVERFAGEDLTVIVLTNRDTEVHDLLRRVADVYLQSQ